MKIALLLASAIAIATPAFADTIATPATATKGQMLIGADNARLGAVSRVNADGSVQIIFDAHVVTVPAATLSTVGGKLTTTLKKREIASLN